MTSTFVKSIHMTELQEIVTKAAENDNMLVVGFTAAWSEPCKFFKPLLEDVASCFKNDAEFYTLDVEVFKDLAQLLKVEVLPTFLLVKNYVVKDRVVGVDKEELVSSIQKHTGKVAKTIDYSEPDRRYFGGAGVAQESKGKMTPTRAMAIQNNTELEDVWGKTSLKLVVLMLTAAWSLTCKYFKPMFEDIASSFKNDAEFYMLDVDKFKDFARRVEVEFLPTFLLVTNNRVKDRVVGVDKEKLVSSIQKHTGKVVKTLTSERDRGHYGGGGQHHRRQASVEKLERSIEKDTEANKVDNRSVIGANNNSNRGNNNKHNKENLNGSSIVEKHTDDVNKVVEDRVIDAEKDRLREGSSILPGHHAGAAGVAGEPAAAAASARLTVTFFTQDQTVGDHPEAGGKPRPSKKRLSTIWAWARGRPEVCNNKVSIF